jgi:sigma-E factor negative regulatory protein RseB
MGEAARAVNYQGVLVYRDDEMFETLSLVHRHQGGRERERLVSLSGEQREISRGNDEVMWLLPKQQSLSAGATGEHGLFPRMSRETVEKLSANYELRVLGQARVAGRLCRGVQVKPRDVYRYGYLFCADEQTGVPLKVTLMTPENRRVEELVFTQIEFPRRIPDSAFAPEHKSKTKPARKVAATQTAAKGSASPSRWVLRELPPGFAITMRDLRPLPDQRGELEHVQVSDGLSAVSVFMARQPPPERSFQGFSRMGAVHAYGRMLGEYHVAVVGEVPKETVRMIGDGLRSTDDDAEDLPPGRSLLPPPTP